MSDIVSARPASGAPIATAWGAEIHDAIEGIQTGSVVVTISNTQTATGVITFPRPYAAPPKVFYTIAATNSNYVLHAWIPAAGVTATQANIAVGRDDATAIASASVTVSWLAIGTPA